MSPEDAANQRESVPTMETGRRSLAVRWTNWAANLLVSGVIIVVGLVFGREMLQWWYVDASPDSAPSSDSPPIDGAATLATESQAELQFGDWPLAFRHGATSADLSEAIAQLKQECARAARNAAAPRSPPGPAESRLLADLAGQKPEMELPAGGRLFLRVRPLPMVVAVTGGSASDAQRVAAWGVLFPNRNGEPVEGDVERREGGWSWFTWRTAEGQGVDGGGPGRPSDNSVDLPDLPGGRRTLTIRLPTGELRVGYTGTATGPRWRDAFEAWSAKHGWRADGGWEARSHTWYGRFLHDDPPRRTQVLIREEPSGQVQAFLNVSPAAAAQ